MNSRQRRKIFGTGGSDTLKDVHQISACTDPRISNDDAIQLYIDTVGVLEQNKSTCKDTTVGGDDEIIDIRTNIGKFIADSNPEFPVMWIGNFNTGVERGKKSKEDANVISNISGFFSPETSHNIGIGTISFGGGGGKGIHYTSFICNKEKHKIYFFDPGRGLYPDGPMLTLLKKYIGEDNFEDFTITTCQGESGKCMQCQGDSFCQTWVFFFLYKYIQTKNFGFLVDWENETNRKKMILEFIVNILLENENRLHIDSCASGKNVTKNESNGKIDACAGEEGCQPFYELSNCRVSSFLKNELEDERS